MATGISLFFLAVGAILTFAVHTPVSGIDLDTVGVILMVIGLLGMLFSLVLWDSKGQNRAEITVNKDGGSFMALSDESKTRATISATHDDHRLRSLHIAVVDRERARAVVGEMARVLECPGWRPER